MAKEILRFLAICTLLLILGCPEPPTKPPQDDKPKVKRDFNWSVDTMFFDTPGISPPEQVYMYSIWGSCPTDVWAAGHSDIPWGRLWHYDGKRWTPAKNWPVNGMDGGKSYIVYPFAVTGFDAQNVFVACDRYYEGSDSAMVMKWNGSTWIDVSWQNNSRVLGGLNRIVQQNKNTLWAVTASGYVVKYINGLMCIEPNFLDSKINDQYYIAPLDNGEVFVNFLRDSVENESQKGKITKLFLRNSNGDWSLVEDKFIAGAYEDGNGLGLGVLSVGNRLFTTNRGLWEKKGNSWTQVLSLDNFGGSCLVAENNLWIYFRHKIWQYNGDDWINITIPLLDNFSGSFLYGQGWSDGNEIFLSLHHNGKTYIVHGK